MTKRICGLGEISARGDNMQDILWMCLELIANMCESFLCVHFIICSFNGRCRLTNSKIAHIIGTLGMTAIVTVLNIVTDYEGLLGLIYAVDFIVFSTIFLSGSFLKKLFISILTNIVLISTAALTANVLFAIFKDEPLIIYTEHSLERFIFIVTGIALRAYVFALLKRFTGGKRTALRTKEWILILSVLIISTLIIAAMHEIILDDTNSSHINLLMFSEIGIIFINILCLYMTANLSETHKREEKLLLEQKRNEYNQQYAQSIKEQYEQTRRLRHDMKQYTASLSALIKEKKYDAASELLNKQSENLSSVETIIDAENDLVNAILNTKLTYAKSKGIDVICSVEKDILGIDDMDLCNLLGNMLDNAITAAEKCELDSRSIEAGISSSGSRLTVLIKNSVKSSVLKDNPQLKSTKNNFDEHGFGIKTIKYIAEKYNGRADFYEDGLTFICRVELHKTDNN